LSYNENNADEFDDHRGNQALDGICQAVHEYAFGQRPLFGNTGLMPGGPLDCGPA
jgi:hypothetical protein